MTKISDLTDTNRPPKILLYGAAGTGKTALVTQLGPKGLILDFDNGLRTAITLKDSFSSLRHQTNCVLSAEPNPAAPSTWLKAKSLILDLQAQLASGTCPYDALVIDSLTGMGEAIKAQILYQCNKPMAKPDLREHGLIADELELALTIIRHLPILVIITAHEMPVDLESGSTVYKILCPGKKLPPKLPGMFDELWYSVLRTESKGSRYLISARKTGLRDARTRSSLKEDFDHTEAGLKGLLAAIGFTRNPV